MRDFFTRRSTVRHPLLLALGFMILAAVSAASVWLVDQAETEAKWVTHTLAVENQLRSVVQYIRRAESGQRSYLLTASPEDLETYRTGVASVQAALESARALTVDNPTQQQALAALEPDVRQRLDDLAETIRLFDAGGRDGAAARVRSGRGRVLTESIVAQVARMQDAERRLFEARSQDFRRTTHWLLAATFLGALFIVLLAALSVFLVRRAGRELEAAHQALGVSYAGLEETVAARAAELRESEALKGAILESALDCVVTITDESRIVEWNPAAERTFGYPRETALGQPLAELIIPPEFRERHHEGLARYLATGEGPVLGKRIELEALRADGSRLPVELAITAAHVENKTHFTAYLRDITERKRAQSELLESNEEIQRFAYIVSHDLRAPLVNIMGFTSELEALRDDLIARLRKLRAAAPDGKAGDDETLAQEFDEALGFIKASIAKMDRLINAILKLSREGGRAFKPERVEMEALLNGIAHSLAHQAEAAGARFDIGDLPPLTSDRLALEQIFSNLLDNALKYLRPGEPGRIAVTGRAAGSRVIYEVRDNGRGIERRDQERVFELFRRAGAQDRPGEGIGLTHVRALVRRLGGTIRLESEPGCGSTFTIALPKAWAAESERKAA